MGMQSIGFKSLLDVDTERNGISCLSWMLVIVIHGDRKYWRRNRLGVKVKEFGF